MELNDYLPSFEDTCNLFSQPIEWHLNQLIDGETSNPAMCMNSTTMTERILQDDRQQCTVNKLCMVYKFVHKFESIKLVYKFVHTIIVLL